MPTCSQPRVDKARIHGRSQPRQVAAQDSPTCRQRTESPRVVGSMPTLATTTNSLIHKPILPRRGGHRASMAGTIGLPGIGWSGGGGDAWLEQQVWGVTQGRKTACLANKRAGATAGSRSDCAFRRQNFSSFLSRNDCPFEQLYRALRIIPKRTLPDDDVSPSQILETGQRPAVAHSVRLDLVLPESPPCSWKLEVSAA